ncbi:hypothetical protein DFH27DRAFT_322462 [Peziza echinospora]|nr:hypothetical protein DFH27DRAFT_322462 [Peziza echinospora]
MRSVSSGALYSFFAYTFMYFLSFCFVIVFRGSCRWPWMLQFGFFIFYFISFFLFLELLVIIIVIVVGLQRRMFDGHAWMVVLCFFFVVEI